MASPNDRVDQPFAYLKKDHDKAAILLERLSETTERAEKARTEGFAELEAGLRLHMELEERVVYPRLLQLDELRGLVQEGVEEHHVAKILLNELASLAPTDEQWTAKMKVLKESIEHHAEEEEEAKIFPAARQALGREQEKALALAMQEFLSVA